MSTGPIDAVTLTDHGQDPASVAERLVGFLDGARTSLDMAVYDVHFGPRLAGIFAAACRRACDRGVALRLVHCAAVDRPTNGPPPPRTDPAVVALFCADTVAIPPEPDLMHHKYVVRDRAAVWTGSTNWSDDSWSREENVVVTVDSPALAAVYADDFAQLWRSREVARSGRTSTAPIDVGGVEVRPWFTPGHARQLVHRIAAALGHARRRVRIASPVITSGPILGTLGEALEGGVDIGIVVDGTQVNEVLRQWEARRGWKRAMLERVARDPRTHAKVSTPWSPTSVHDFMHAKTTIVDDTVFVGSYNLSRSGETNAEDVLEVADAALADRLAAYVDSLRARYGPFRAQ